MKVAFRADASLQMGSGHIMRCLTLADALIKKGTECHFLCRELPGHLIELIRGKGHATHVLPCVPENPIDSNGPAHAAWLGATLEQDVRACHPTLQALRPDWLVVDHYALDIRWETALMSYCRRLMVIDDLADRSHQCNLLLDQNLGRHETDYVGMIPQQCTVLAGPRYALLRPEFTALREYSIRRREDPRLRKLLISMGGVDRPNATSRVLETLQGCALPDDCQVKVVMGPSAPWLQQVRDAAKKMPWTTEVLVNVTEMGTLMANSDLSIGAAGSTSWERCCLGLPSIILVLAENQKFISFELEKAGAAKVISLEEESLEVQLKPTIDSYRPPAHLREAAKRAALVCDGLGVERVGRILLGE
ncbi:UDP-2,4-diacetamido-2,4,6-trideoxy-beta-L-altropyranose hydrolase [Billgrantia antri]|uniref:UDP-2,4-diacetamido-2,4, 6-trideoxy-beta-L-altropyranose hydrolase n=1 Tax=Billgrantia antri TaxID=2846777 RepID=UPI003B223C0E